MPTFRYSRFKSIYGRAPTLQRLKSNNGFQSLITPDINPFGVEYISINRGQTIYNNVGILLHSSQAFLSPNLKGIGITEHSRGFSAQAGSEEPRDSLEYDVVIVGAGPAGLSAAIKLKQLCREKNRDISVCVVEKGAEVGAHILSGNVFEPRSLNELIPDWKEQGAPIRVPVSCDKFWLLTENRSFPLPSPFNNEGNYVISLSELVRWLSQKAEELGVEIYPGFAASEVLRDASSGKVIGIATNDMGIAKDGSKKENFQRGVELKGRVTLLGEGCRGLLSERVIKYFNLRQQGNAQHQSYAIGIKEVWEIEERKHKPGFVLHTIGWPLDMKTYGGSFLYHMNDQQVSIGSIVALNYQNPYLSPYEEFQKFKQHPSIKPLLEGGRVVQYGARSLNEGGFQSIPKPVFPGGALIGCSAGFLNVPKIKGTHTAMKSGSVILDSRMVSYRFIDQPHVPIWSHCYPPVCTSWISEEPPKNEQAMLIYADFGMLAAEAAFDVLCNGADMEVYWDILKKSWIWDELYRVRNMRPAFNYGLIPGLGISALEHYIIKGRLPWTLKHGKHDHEATEFAEMHTPIKYPKPDGVVSFDLLTSLYRSNTNHDHNQPGHLRLRDPRIPLDINLPRYAGPETRYCPARVYEYVPDENGHMRFHINAQNCLHCKACDIKDPKQNIEWTVPEGGGGPGYSVM